MTNDPADQTGGADAPSAEPMDMAALLAEADDFRAPQRGEIVEGVIMGWDREGALVDIGAKSEGVILRHEMQSLGSDAESHLKEDDKVMVYIVHPETADGQIMLSLDKARGEQGWLTLQERFDSSETFEAEVTGFNKGGLLVNVEGVNAFVPLSQVVGVRPDRNREDGESSLGEVVGKNLRLKVIEINRRRNRVILSERAALQEWRMQQKERLIEELNEGDIRKGRISSVRNFGVFVDLGGADGLAHLSELSWDRDKSPSELFKVGDEVDVYITKIDAENKKIALSLRRANPEKWQAVVGKYDEGQVVTGLVTKLVTFGAFARIEGPVEGLIHVSELVDRRIGHPRDVVREGDLLPLKIVRIEHDRHRLGLSLRRARDEGEGMGYVFSEGGEVISVPEEIRTEFEAREGPIPTPPEPQPDELNAAAAATMPAADVATPEAPSTAPDETKATEAPSAAAAAPIAPVEEEEPMTGMAAAIEQATAAKAPAAETPEAEATETETPAAEATETETPAAEATETEAPAAEATETEAPAAEATETEAPAAEATETEAPAAEATETEVPAAEATETETPAAEATETEAPAAEATETEAPEAEATETETPEAEATETEEEEPTAAEASAEEAATAGEPAEEPPADETESASPAAGESEEDDQAAEEAPESSSPLEEDPSTSEASIESKEEGQKTS